MKTPRRPSSHVANLSTALACALVAACGVSGLPEAPPDRANTSSPAPTMVAASEASGPSNLAVLGEFVGYVDPARGILDIRMVRPDQAGAVLGELATAHRPATTDSATGWCRATVERDGTPGTGSAGTVELYTPWGEVDKTIPDCLDRIGDSAFTEASFPNGVLCADVVVRSFFTSQLDNVYAEITSHTGSSNQYGYAYPLGTGAERPDFGRNRPAVDFGLWSYGSLGPADGHVGEPLSDPPDEKTVVWTFKYGSTTPFSFSGRLVYAVEEQCGDGDDDDCDGVNDNACGSFSAGAACFVGADCASGICEGADLDADTAGTCKSADPPARRVAVHDRKTCALEYDGSIRCWGFSPSPGLTGNFQEIDLNRIGMCGFRADSSRVLCDTPLGLDASPTTTGGWSTFDVGANHACVVRESGTVWCYGTDKYGETRPPSGVTFSRVALGRESSCGLTTDKEIRCWGLSSWVDATPTGADWKRVDVSITTPVGCGIHLDGTIECWSSASFYMSALGTPPTGSFDEVEVGGLWVCALDSAGEITCWGRDGEAPLTGVPTGRFSALAETGYAPKHMCAIRASDSQVVCWGDGTDGATTVPSDLQMEAP